MVQRVCLQFVIVVFPDHTHLHFFVRKFKKNRSRQFLIRIPLAAFLGNVTSSQVWFKCKICTEKRINTIDLIIMDGMAYLNF